MVHQVSPFLFSCPHCHSQPVHRSQVAVVVVLIVSMAATAAAAVSQQSEFPIQGKSFSLRSIVSTYHPQTVHTRQIVEAYSAEQQRAKITYRAFERTSVASRLLDQGAFLVDRSAAASGRHQINLRLTSDRQAEWNYCEQTSLDEMTRILFASYQLETMADALPPDALYVVGPARLLFLVHKHEAEMKPANAIRSSVRNIPAIANSFAYKTDHQFTVYYNEADYKQNRRIPMHIQIRHPTHGLMTLDYSLLEMSAAAAAETATLGGGGQPAAALGDLRGLVTAAGTSKASLDPFAFPLAAGCSIALANKVGEDIILAGKRPETIKFSFRALLEPTYVAAASRSENTAANSARQTTVVREENVGGGGGPFVAYDGALNSMRFEMAEVAGELTQPPTERRVFNFKLNRAYDVVERNLEDDSADVVQQVMSMNERDDAMDSTLMEPPSAASSGDSSTTVQCMVARIDPWDPARFGGTIMRPFSVGQLLAGADKFVYMGRARVRGVSARVYEAQAGMQPFWLEQQFAYRTLEDTGRLRDPEMGAQLETPKPVLIVVLYFGEATTTNTSGSQEDTSNRGPLLQVEIHKLHPTQFTVLTRRTIHIHNFVWKLAEAPNGDPPTELFSLEDLCSANLGGNQHAQVEVLMRSLEPRPPTGSPFYVASLRNQALLASLQDDFELPATMIYDLESKLLNPTPATEAAALKSKLRGGGGEGDNPAAQRLLVSFRFAKHVDNLVELTYLGQARENPSHRGARLKLPSYSFQACFFLAAHRRADVYFAYDRAKSCCLIDLTRISASYTAAEQPTYFEMEPGQALEVYRTIHSKDSTLDLSTGAQISLSRLRRGPKRKPLLRDIYDPVSGSGDMTFQVLRLHIDDRNLYERATSAAAASAATNIGVKGRMVSGFGLLETGAGNRRVAPMQLNSANWSPLSFKLDPSHEASTTSMSYEQCHAACLSDFECQSFSVCIRDFDVQCVVSNASFKSPEVAKQLDEAALLKGPSKLVVMPSDETMVVIKTKRQGAADNEVASVVELIRHPNCQLYNKNFLDLFGKPRVNYETLARRRNYAVASQEQCAELCFRRNLEVLRQDARQAARLFAALGPQSNNKAAEQVEQVAREHSEALKEMCEEFLYLERAQLALLRKEFEQSIRAGVLELPTTTPALGQQQGAAEVIAEEDAFASRTLGYCTLGARQSQRERQELEKAARYMDSGESQESQTKREFFALDVYPFKSETFFEKQSGVKLRSSGMTQDEMAAYLTVRGHAERAPDRRTYSVLKSYVGKGSNAVSTIAVSASECALKCLTDQMSPWPACRSFDFVVEFSGASPPQSSAFCQMNSITLRQAVANKRFDLIEPVNKSGWFVWHYEPRPGFALDEANFRAELEMASQSQQDSSRQPDEAACRRNIHTFSLLCLVLLATMSGVFAGFQLGQRVLNHRLGVGTQSSSASRRSNKLDKQVLVGPRTEIEFSNQVNHEGVVAAPD